MSSMKHSRSDIHELVAADCKRRAAQRDQTNNNNNNGAQHTGYYPSRVRTKYQQYRSNKYQPRPDPLETSVIQIANYSATPRRRKSSADPVAQRQPNNNRHSLNLSVTHLQQKLNNLFHRNSAVDVDNRRNRMSTPSAHLLNGSPSVPADLGGRPKHTAESTTLKEKFKNAWAAGSAKTHKTANGRVSISHSDLSERSKNGGRVSPIVQLRQNSDPFASHRHELDRTIRYLHEVIRTGKVEMLGGSASAILECVLRLMLTVNSNNEMAALLDQGDARREFEKVYKCVTDVIRWADETVVERAAQKPNTLLQTATSNRSSKSSASANSLRNSTDFSLNLVPLSLEEATRLTTDLRLAFDSLIAEISGERQTQLKDHRKSADSGTASSFDDDLRNNNNATPTRGILKLEHLKFIDQCPSAIDDLKPPEMKSRVNRYALDSPEQFLAVPPPVPPRSLKPPRQSNGSSNNDSGYGGTDSQYAGSAGSNSSNGSSPSTANDSVFSATGVNQTETRTSVVDDADVNSSSAMGNRLFSAESLEEILHNLNITKPTKQSTPIRSSNNQQQETVRDSNDKFEISNVSMSAAGLPTGDEFRDWMLSGTGGRQLSMFGQGNSNMQIVPDPNRHVLTEQVEEVGPDGRKIVTTRTVTKERQIRSHHTHHHAETSATNIEPLSSQEQTMLQQMIQNGHKEGKVVQETQYRQRGRSAHCHVQDNRQPVVTPVPAPPLPPRLNKLNKRCRSTESPPKPPPGSAPPPLPPRQAVMPPNKPSTSLARPPPRPYVKSTGVAQNVITETRTTQAYVDDRMVDSHSTEVSDARQVAYNVDGRLGANGEVMDRRGHAIQRGMRRTTDSNDGPQITELPPSTTSNNSKPPLPRRRQQQNVATYLRVFDVYGDEVKCSTALAQPNGSVVHQNGHRDRSSDARKRAGGGSNTEEFRHSTLASYVMLRDNLSQYEHMTNNGPRSHSPSTRRSGIGFPSGSPVKHQAKMLPPRPATHDFANLENLLQFDQDDRLRMPRKFVDLLKDFETSEVTEDLYVKHQPVLPLGSSNVKVNEAPAKQHALVKQVSLPASTCVSETERYSPVLTELDVKDYLVLRARDGELGEVRGGPADALIAHATQPDNTLLLYQEAFITTYRTFVTPLQLLKKLVYRYKHFHVTPTAVDADQGRRKVARHTFSLIVRVVDELAPIELTMEAVNYVNTFIYRLFEQGELTLVRLLRQRFVERIDEKGGFKKIVPLQRANASIKRATCILDIKSSTIAEQMTVLDSELFHRIELSEMLCWAQNQSEETSPNLVVFTTHFNQMSYWVRSKVIDQPDQREREKYYWKFIKVMRHLRRLGNFNSYLAVLSALDSGPIRRLEWSKGIQDAMIEHSGIMDSSQSFRNYRNALAQTPPPCLPYIGLILQDLTFIHVGNSNELLPERCQGREGLINFGKRWQQFAILDSVRKFKSWTYDFERNESVVSTFNNFNDFLSEDEIWTMSEELKPRGSGRKS